MSCDRTVDKDRSEKDKKKDLDRLKKDLSELADKPSDPKRARLDSPALSSSSHTPSPTPPPSRGEADASDGGGSEVEFGDLEMNLEFDCSCCVCKTFTQESGNKLMECSSCQNLYHQECHNPPVRLDKFKYKLLTILIYLFFFVRCLIMRPVIPDLSGTV